MSIGDLGSWVAALSAIGALLCSIVNGLKIHRVYISINSRMDMLLQIKGDAMKAEGIKEEAERARGQK